jgi:hypothetical protein
VRNRGYDPEKLKKHYEPSLNQQLHAETNIPSPTQLHDNKRLKNIETNLVSPMQPYNKNQLDTETNLVSPIHRYNNTQLNTNTEIISPVQPSNNQSETEAISRDPLAQYSNNTYTAIDTAPISPIQQSHPKKDSASDPLILHQLENDEKTNNDTETISPMLLQHLDEKSTENSYLPPPTLSQQSNIASTSPGIFLGVF